MKPYLLIVLVILVVVSQHPVYAQSEECLPPRFLGGQAVRVTGLVDAGGLPFRDQPSLSEPVNGIIPLDTVISSKQTLLCVEGRNWYTVFYTPPGEEAPKQVWVMDGDGATYWLEPTPIGLVDRVQLLPSSPMITQNLVVDSFDSQTSILRFSLEIFEEESRTYARRYFDLNLNTGILTEVDYWYRDIITREFTDRLGITEQVFGNGEDFSRIWVSPDREKVLYIAINRPADCTGNCSTEITAWITDSAGDNPIPLGSTLFDYFNDFSSVIWEADGRILLSAPNPLVYIQDITLIVCQDGSCAGEAEDILLAGRSALPFTYIKNMPTFSPDNEWIAMVAGDAEINTSDNPTAGFILNQETDQYIQLPFNGDAAVSIQWLDNDTILYPVAGIGWDGRDYGLPYNFYEQNALWEIHLDFDNLTYRIGDPLASWASKDRTDEMFDTIETFHIINSGDGVIIYNYLSLVLYRFGRG